MLVEMKGFLPLEDVADKYRVPESLLRVIQCELDKVEVYPDARTGAKMVYIGEVDDLIEKVVRQDRLGRPDGVYRPSCVRVGGIDYDCGPNKRWLLIDCLWGKPSVSETDVIEAVYGADADPMGKALASLTKHTNAWFRSEGCPLTVQTRKGHLRLVRTDR